MCRFVVDVRTMYLQTVPPWLAVVHFVPGTRLARWPPNTPNLHKHQTPSPRDDRLDVL